MSLFEPFARELASAKTLRRALGVRRCGPTLRVDAARMLRMHVEKDAVIASFALAERVLTKVGRKRPGDREKELLDLLANRLHVECQSVSRRGS